MSRPEFHLALLQKPDIPAEELEKIPLEKLLFGKYVCWYVDGHYDGIAEDLEPGCYRLNVTEMVLDEKKLKKDYPEIGDRSSSMYPSYCEPEPGKTVSVLFTGKGTDCLTVDIPQEEYFGKYFVPEKADILCFRLRSIAVWDDYTDPDDECEHDGVLYRATDEELIEAIRNACPRDVQPYESYAMSDSMWDALELNAPETYALLEHYRNEEGIVVFAEM